MAINIKKAWCHKMDFTLLLNPLSAMERTGLMLIVTFLSLQDFLNEWVWHPFWTLGVLLVVLTADLVTGIALSFKNNEGFSTNKFTTWLFTVAGYVFILVSMYNLPRINEVMFWPPLSPILMVIARCFYVLILLNVQLSAIKNLVVIGALKGWLALLAIRYLDTYKNRVEQTLIKSVESIRVEREVK